MFSDNFLSSYYFRIFSNKSQAITLNIKFMSEEVCNLLYDKIKQLCNEKGTNIMRVEKEAGLSNATIRKWNESCPSAENLNAVAKVLNVTVDSLLN
mgnify:CR=1 FL=1